LYSIENRTVFRRGTAARWRAFGCESFQICDKHFHLSYFPAHITDASFDNAVRIGARRCCPILQNQQFLDGTKANISLSAFGDEFQIGQILSTILSSAIGTATCFGHQTLCFIKPDCRNRKSSLFRKFTNRGTNHHFHLDPQVTLACRWCAIRAQAALQMMENQMKISKTAVVGVGVCAAACAGASILPVLAGAGIVSVSGLGLGAWFGGIGRRPGLGGNIRPQTV
jgi:hypothetical protein